MIVDWSEGKWICVSVRSAPRTLMISSKQTWNRYDCISSYLKSQLIRIFQTFSKSTSNKNSPSGALGLESTPSTFAFSRMSLRLFSDFSSFSIFMSLTPSKRCCCVEFGSGKSPLLRKTLAGQPRCYHLTFMQ